jgi:predicted NUDIX family phosphoesterase
MPKEALVVARDVLFKDKYFEGFLPIHAHNFIPKILSNYSYYPRGDELEHNAALQQIIPYVWLLNTKTKKVFAYKRIPGKGDYVEKRLMNKLSCGLGGHIDREDSADPIMNAMMRELEEEIEMKTYPQPKIVGYLKLEEGVSAVHFGIVAIAETHETEITSADGVKEGSWYTPEELEAAFKHPDNQVEEWTTASWPFVKEHLKKVK